MEQNVNPVTQEMIESGAKTNILGVLYGPAGIGDEFDKAV